MFTYEDALQFIHGIARFGSKPGLRRVALLLERMGNPQNQLKFVHVAGSDGKGSTCTMLSYILAKAGYRTGLYISPFVLDFRERIQFNNEMIEKDALTASTELVKSHWDALDAEGEPPTEFEVVVAIAFDYFLRKRCDIVVLEVGMGGLYDATNIIETPVCSVITRISMDHMEYLGNTLAEIATQKAGIIKRRGVTVCYPRQEPEALAAIMKQCAVMENPLCIAQNATTKTKDIFGSDILYGTLALHIPLAGEHQVLNAMTVVETVKAIALRGFPVRDADIVSGIASTRFPSRVEALCRDPLVLLDGGHNPAEAGALCRTLELLGDRPIHAIMGMLTDKDVEACVAQLLPRFASVAAVTPHIYRAMPAEDFALLARRYCPEVTVYQSTKEAVSAVLGCLRGDAVAVVCGSLYLASELRPLLLQAVENRIFAQK